MNRAKILAFPLCILLLVMAFIPSPQAQMRSQDGDEGAILVGRISYIEGHLFRYDPDQEEWERTFEDTPFGVNDSLSSDRDGKAEIIMPNNTWIRMNGDSRIHLIILRDDLTEIEIHSGTARFYNKGSYPVIKARTPFGYVMAPAKTRFDLYVEDDSVEVIALKGSVYFTHDKSGERYEVIAESTSIIADNLKVMAGKPYGDPSWEAWNRRRDTLWAKRMDSKRKSARYLPPSLYDHAYILDEHGVWDRVFYDGGYYYLWRPLYVGVAWAPFTVGCWTVWHREYTWIPYEPFGYATHHYGNWVFTRGRWYWAPPVARARVYAGPPLLNIAFAWYPGRIAWIHFGVNIGWVPLAPHEPYYCYHRWGPKTVVVKNVNVTFTKNIHGYKHYKHAVIINKNDFQRFKNYRNFKIIHANNASLLKKYRVSPFPKSNVKKNHRNEGQKYNFAKLDVQRRPPQTLVKKIEPNKLTRKKTTTLSKKPARKDVQHIGVQYPKKSEWVSPQKAKDRINQIIKAKTTKSQTRLEKRSLKAGAHLRTKDQMHARMGIEPRSKKEFARPVTRKTSKTENHPFARSKIEKHWQERRPRPANEGTFSWHDKDLGTKQLNESLPPGLKAQLQSRQARGKANQNPSYKVRQSIKNEGQLRRGKR